MNCCRSCGHVMQICQQPKCECHDTEDEKNLHHDTLTYRNPTERTALNRVARYEKSKR